MGQAGPRAPQTFPLRASCLGASGQGVTLEPDAVVWRTRDGEHRRAFDAIVSLDVDWEIGGDEPDGRCDFGFADSLAMTVHLDHGKPAEIAAYCSFVLALRERLAAHAGRILFRHGSSPSKRLAAIIVIAILLALMSGSFLFAVVSPETYQEPYQWLLLPLNLAFVVALGFGLRAAIRSGRKPFDLADLPRLALAPDWRKANGIVD